jgi:hypothetical protein
MVKILYFKIILARWGSLVTSDQMTDGDTQTLTFGACPRDNGASLIWDVNAIYKD